MRCVFFFTPSNFARGFVCDSRVIFATFRFVCRVCMCIHASRQFECMKLRKRHDAQACWSPMTYYCIHIIGRPNDDDCYRIRVEASTQHITSSIVWLRQNSLQTHTLNKKTTFGLHESKQRQHEILTPTTQHDGIRMVYECCLSVNVVLNRGLFEYCLGITGQFSDNSMFHSVSIITQLY